MNILEQLYEGALNPADSIVYTDEYDCLREKSMKLEDTFRQWLQTDHEIKLYDEVLDIHNHEECEFGKISFCQGFSLATKIIMHSMGMQTEKPKDIWLETEAEEEKDNGRIPCQELLMERCMDISSTLTDASSSYRRNSRHHIGLLMELQRGEKGNTFSDYEDIWCDLSYAIAIPAYLYGGNLADGAVDWQELEQRLDGLYASPRFQELWGRYGALKEKLIEVFKNPPAFSQARRDKLEEHERCMRTEIRLESYLAVYLGYLDRMEIMSWLKGDDDTDKAEIEKWLMEQIPDIDLEMIED